jgi:hypothetical protein
MKRGGAQPPSVEMAEKRPRAPLGLRHTHTTHTDTDTDTTHTHAHVAETATHS